jgi:hypothetical protein
MKYYLGIDEGTQWFYYLIKSETDGKAEKIDLNSDVARTEFCQNLLNKDSYGRKEFKGIYDTVFGYVVWPISEKEFDKLKRMCDLVQSWREFQKLAKYD